MPAPLGGVIIAMLVATPEAIGATRSALDNKLQRSINIFLGSVLSTIGLTVPVMLVISYLTAHEVFLGLASANNLLLAVTLASAWSPSPAAAPTSCKARCTWCCSQPL